MLSEAEVRLKIYALKIELKKLEEHIRASREKYDGKRESRHLEDPGSRHPDVGGSNRSTASSELEKSDT
jgi:hypothetical protein